MALLDLSMVTKALTSLVQAHISTSPAWTFGQAPKVTGQPPDKLEPGTLGVYLYHVTEDGYLKNVAGLGHDPVPVRLVPMAVSLHYQVTAVGAGTGEQPTFQEQVLVGCAAKALHDHPVVDDATVLARKAPQPPLEVLKAVGLDGEGNTLRISLQPVTAPEASGYWNSGSLATRLSLYYQVSAVLLEPERPKSMSGRVLRYGVQSFAGSAPRLDGAQNTVHVEVPGLPPQDLVARPAEVPIDGRVTVTGYNLRGDVDSRLVLQHARWSGPVEVDDTWTVTGTDDELSATVREAAGTQAVVPGTYTARVRVIRRRSLPDGTTRDFPVLSNGTPFSIAARIDALTFAADIGTLTGYTFRSPGPPLPPFPPDAVQLSVGDTVLTERTSTGALDPGQFRVESASTVTFRLPAGLGGGSAVSLRLVVLGAESPPRWIEP
ncbi:DUF4255 domain-containing protein [Actinoplanes sp. NEAU-A12]|uniref:DUF4255 domain-containing protein n=1 Tax=Actinoplanes sandaracinus TaxID=3045177 RepID=A0ABT6WWM1_9ACTN|nr:DUF4255 domain-containing protein [Actinoplanes sandaracinus]MDI6104115.1 DUF4255 domain-containing protein [Actinoplanes sandaracinus]